MRFCWFLVLCVVFWKLQAFSRNFDNSALRKAFVNISAAILKGDRLVTLVMGGTSNDEIVFGQFETNHGFPHFVARLKNNCSTFRLKSSAIVSLESVESLEVFNNCTTVPATFSMRQQIFIYFRDGSFDEIAQMKSVSRTKTPII